MLHSLNFRDPNIGLGAGVGGLLILLINRFTLSDISDIQSRADIIAVVSCSALLLNALSNQEIEAKDRDPVPLVGYALNRCVSDDNLPALVKESIAKCCEATLTSTPCKSIFVLWDGRVVARAGIIGSAEYAKIDVMDLKRMPILQKSMSDGSEVYLPDLQVPPLITLK